jgi:hypothetical protein
LRQGSTRYVPSGLAPRPGEFSRLPKQASRGVTSCCSETLVLAHGELPPVLTTAERPSTLKGCVGTLKDGHVRNVPLPKAQRIQSTSHVTSHGAITCDGSTPLNSTPRVNSTPLHSTRVGAASRIRSGGHVTSHGPITCDNVHSTPNSTPLYSTCICVAPRIRSRGQVTSQGPITHDNVHSTQLQSTRVCAAPRI